MRPRSLGETLRLMVLATPLLRATGCGNGNWELCDGGAVTQVVSLVTPPGSGASCHDFCGGNDKCAFVTLADGGPGLSCSSHDSCTGGRRPASLLLADAAQRMLARQLRTLILATPLIVAPGCGTGFPPDCYGSPGVLYGKTAYGTAIFPLPAIDGGTTDCHASCQAVDLTCSYWNSVDSCAFVALSDGKTGVQCTGTIGCGCTGRRPASLVEGSHPWGLRALGGYFAETARLEAASILAFHILAGELHAHRAPVHLVDTATRSAQDEVRHAYATGRLAHRYGATPIRPAFGEPPMERTLEAIATENAIEGCVRETFGALVALWQALHARDPAVATALGPIAEDETRHAELAWEVASWAEPRLSATARRRVQAARAQALADLAAEAVVPVPEPLVTLAGLPPPETAEALIRALANLVYASA